MATRDSGDNINPVPVIADVLLKHRWDSTPVRVSEYPQCACGKSFRYRTDHDAHVSAAVVAALGGLTRQWSYQGEDEDGPWMADVEFDEIPAETPHGYVHGHLVQRWVGGWIPKEAE